MSVKLLKCYLWAQLQAVYVTINIVTGGMNDQSVNLSGYQIYHGETLKGMTW